MKFGEIFESIVLTGEGRHISGIYGTLGTTIVNLHPEQAHEYKNQEMGDEIVFKMDCLTHEWNWMKDKLSKAFNSVSKRQ